MLYPADTEQKQAQKSARHPGKFLGLLYLFRQEPIQRAGAGWIATARTGGESRGTSSIPVDIRLFLGKPCVISLLPADAGKGGCSICDLGRWAVGRHFSAAVGQADYIRTWTKSGFTTGHDPPDRKRSKDISNSRHVAATPLIIPFPSLISHGSCRHCMGSCTVGCKRSH